MLKKYFRIKLRIFNYYLYTLLGSKAIITIIIINNLYAYIITNYNGKKERKANYNT